MISAQWFLKSYVTLGLLGLTRQIYRRSRSYQWYQLWNRDYSVLILVQLQDYRSKDTLSSQQNSEVTSEFIWVDMKRERSWILFFPSFQIKIFEFSLYWDLIDAVSYHLSYRRMFQDLLQYESEWFRYEDKFPRTSSEKSVILELMSNENVSRLRFAEEEECIRRRMIWTRAATKCKC